MFFFIKVLLKSWPKCVVYCSIISHGFLESVALDKKPLLLVYNNGRILYDRETVAKLLPKVLATIFWLKGTFRSLSKVKNVVMW